MSGERLAGVFHYLNPATIYWGAGSIERLSGELDRAGVRRPFLVSTQSILGNAGLMAALRRAAGRPLAGVAGAIGQHAPGRDVEAAVAAARELNPDGVISLGGGSPIDAAKVVALHVAQAASGDRAPARPHMAIPTTLSAAELAPTAGVTDDAGRKGGERDDRLIPSAVIYDAELALRTPLELWLSTGIRALDHAMESILEPGHHPYSDCLALDSIRRLFASLPLAKDRPGAVETRTENQLGAWLSYSLPRAAAGLSHVLGKQIGSPYGIPHGVTSCLLLPHVMRYRAREQADRLALMAPAMGLAGSAGSEYDLALRVAGAVQRLIARLGLPQHLAAYHLSDEQLRAAAEPVAGDRYPLADLLDIYHAAA